jgi:RNA polymerase sigma-70 factor (ECF subfamily)
MSGMAILSEPQIQMMVETDGTTARGLTSEGSVEALVREHARLVFRIAYSILRNHSDAEDAAQEAFIRVLRNKSKLADVREHKLWLAKIAWNAALDHKKSLARRRIADDDVSFNELPAVGPRADEAMASAQMKALLQKLIATLPADLRETLALSTVQELNSNQIAAVLGIPEGSVRTRLMRARTLLKQKMTAALGERNG